MNRTGRPWSWLSLVAVVMACCPLSARILYVDARVATSGNGSSWSSACQNLRTALAAASAGDEVRVAQGTYRPDQGSGVTRGSRTATFSPKSGVTCRGGYAGLGQDDPNARDVVRFETILSGDLKANDVDVPDPCGLWSDPSRQDNAYAVVTLANADSTCLDGLTITAGLESRSGNPRTDGGLGGGGGVVVSSGSPLLTQCTIKGNAGRKGGGILITAGSLTLTRCQLVNNYAFADGGAIHLMAGSLSLQRCVLAGNKATGNGGAIRLSSTSSLDKLTLTNCIIEGNTALTGSTIDYPPIVSFTPVTSTHCIFWGNTDTGTASYPPLVGWAGHCCLQGGLTSHDGGGNLSADPLWARAGSRDAQGRWIDGDYHLRSQAGRWDPTTQTWVKDSQTSPCIDAGGPTEALGPEPFPNGGIVNIGLYGGTLEASKSYFGKAPCDTILAGDINGDCRVDALDLAILAGHWLENRQEKVSLKWICHSGFRISTSGVVIYVDPYQVPDSPHDATYVLCSHTHTDHFSTADIAKVSNAQTVLLGPPDVVASYGKGQTLAVGQTLQLGSATVLGVRAYNTNKSNHPKASNWLGFVVEIAGQRLYHAGDTDLIEEMRSLEDIDVAMLPVSGTYAMTAAEAATATTYFHPKLAIPMHWGTVLGTIAMAQTFAEKAACPVKIMTAGETLSLE